MAKKSEEIAAAIEADLADPNNLLWAAGTPGLNNDPMNRFPPAIRDHLIQRWAALIEGGEVPSGLYMATMLSKPGPAADRFTKIV